MNEWFSLRKLINMLTHPHLCAFTHWNIIMYKPAFLKIRKINIMRDFIIHILHDILLGWLSQEDKVYETCSMHGSVQKYIKYFVWKIWTARGRPCVDERLVLKLILHRGRVWTGLICSCEYGNETEFCKQLWECIGRFSSNELLRDNCALWS